MNPFMPPRTPRGLDLRVVSQALAGLTPRSGTKSSAGRGSRGGAGGRTGGGGRSGSNGGGRGDGQRGEGSGARDGKEQILGAITLDHDLRIVSANLGAACFDGVTAVTGTPFVDMLPPVDVPAVTQRLRRVTETREPHVARVQRIPKADGSQLIVSLSILPSAPPDDGLTISFIDMARRFHLYAAATSIGTTLDIGETTRALATSLLPWGDVVAVSLDYNVWTGEQVEDRIRLRRAAIAPDRSWPEGFLTPGKNLPEEAGVFLGRAAESRRPGDLRTARPGRDRAGARRGRPAAARPGARRRADERRLRTADRGRRWTGRAGSSWAWRRSGGGRTARWAPSART